MNVPGCSTCLHSRPGSHPNEYFQRCAHPQLPEHADGDLWFAQVVRGFEDDEQGRPWCGPLGSWHEPRPTEDQPA